MRRICVECIEDYTMEGEALCPACQLEHVSRGAVHVLRYPGPGDSSYQGLGAGDVDVDGGDLDSGFYTASLYGEDRPFTRTPSR
jgi:hypothetical protein